MTVPHPIPYQGSKRYLAETILNYFPANAERLVEPFAGSAALSLAAAASGQAEMFLLNDINVPLITLWDAIINHPEALGRRYEQLWVAQLNDKRRFYDLVRTRFNKTHRPYYLLYLLARCVKASVRYNTNGEFNQSPDNRRKGRHPDKMKKDIHLASSLLHGKTQLISADYRDVLAIATPDDIVYMDPPYQGTSSGKDPRYFNGVDFEEFVSALDELNHRNIAYIVSYDGRTGTKSFGKPLPTFLNLHHVSVNAGRSSQATLLGRNVKTVESLYLSPALIEKKTALLSTLPEQLSLFEL